MSIAADIVAHAETLVGTPYVHHGRRPGVDGGLDCFGVLVDTAQAVGLAHEDFKDYSRDVDGSEIEERLAAYCDRIDPKDVSIGDILLFWIENRRNPQHFGILMPGGFLHARERLAGPSKVYIQPLDRYWTERIYSNWRYRWPQQS